jgi:hypothetical protein
MTNVTLARYFDNVTFQDKCHCEEQSDEAISMELCSQRLLRFARNDERLLRFARNDECDIGKILTEVKK